MLETAPSVHSLQQSYRRDMTKSRFETGIKIKYLQSNRPNGQMFFNILATVAEFERGLIRLKTCEGMSDCSS
ncbi:recombinase family protein [Vibrio sp. M250220]|uniref:recombinase family protein n=1 Tax=Vibrio sp. M250220 TaxID=3020894 RepID=UPI003FCDD710